MSIRPSLWVVKMWCSSSNYSICKEGSGYCAALSGLPRGKAGRIGCPDPQDLFCPPCSICPQGHAWESMPWAREGLGLSHRSSKMLARVPLAVLFSVSGLLLIFNLLSIFRAISVTNPMCQLFKGMLFLLVQSEARSSKAGFQRDP